MPERPGLGAQPLMTRAQSVRGERMRKEKWNTPKKDYALEIDRAGAAERKAFKEAEEPDRDEPIIQQRKTGGGTSMCCGCFRSGPDFRGMFKNAETPDEMKSAMTTIGVAHTVEDFAEAQSSRLFYKSWAYCFGGLSEIFIFAAAVAAFLSAADILKDDGPQIAAFIAGGLALLGLSLQKLGVNSSREYSQRTNEVNRYIRAYGLGIEPHVLLDQLNGHVEKLSDSDRAKLQALADKVRAV